MKTNKEITAIIDSIKKIMPADRVLVDEPMSKHTSFRIGGPAAALVTVDNEEELTSVLAMLCGCTGGVSAVPYMLTGNGSNLLVSDSGYPGIVIKLGGDFSCLEQDAGDPCLVKAGAAKLMSGVSSFLTEHGLAGFEFASGIPGSIGGAVFMNAGAYGGEMKDVVESVRVLVLPKQGENNSALKSSCSAFKTAGRFGTIKTLSNGEMHFGYRHSIAGDENMLILSAMLRLKEDEPEKIAKRVQELQEKRNAKQPLNYPSAGSTFKRPVGGFAAALIEQSGLKGFRVGGAMVSDKHSGFVVNTGGATCEDVLAVMRHVREKVYDDSGILLEPEVRLINCSL